MSKNLPQTPQDALMTAFKADLEKVTPYLEDLIPYKGGVQKFVQMTKLAVLRNPDLLTKNRRSLLLAILWCAQKDLEPGVEDGAWLISFKQMVVPVPAYKGLIKKAEETESVKDVQPYGIYEKDDFEFTLGVDPHMTHKPPKLGVDRGKLIGAYVVITKPDCSKRFHVMDREAVEKIRNSSPSWKAGGSGPWKDWEDAMFLKTVIKQGLKYIPVKPVLRDLLADDGRLEAGESVAILLRDSGADLPEGMTGEETPPPEPEPIDTSAFDKLVEEKLATITVAEEYKLHFHRVEEYVNAIAASQKKAKVTPAEVKVDAVSKFAPYQAEFPDPENPKKMIMKTMPGFWNSFLGWEAKKYPVPVTAATAASPPAGETASGPPTASPSSGPEDECPFPPVETGSGEASPPTTSATDPTFEGRRLALWDSIIDKQIPLSELADPKFGVTKLQDITPENFANVKWFADNYQPAKKRGRK